MSEPDFRIGVDEELVSSLESLHEDLYFVTLDFFDALGRTTTRRRLAAPGKIFPIIHPERRGQAGHRCACSTPATRRPSRSSRSRYKEKGGEKPTTVRRELGEDRHDAAAGRCARSSAPMRSARSSCRSRPKDDREAARAADALDALARLHAAGLFKTALSYDHVDRVAAGDRARRTRARAASCATTGAAAPSNVRTARGQADARRSSRGITSSAPTSPRRSSASSRRIPRSRPTRPGARIAAATSR